MNKEYVIPKELMEEVWAYLLNRPAREVFELVDKLQKQSRLVEIQVATATVSKEGEDGSRQA